MAIGTKFLSEHVFKHKKYLKSVHLKLTTCCSKNYPVVLSFSTHNQNFEYNSKPQSLKIPSESIPQSQKFSSKSISQSQNFQAKNYPKLANIRVLPHSKISPGEGTKCVTRTLEQISRSCVKGRLIRYILRYGSKVAPVRTV